MARPLRLGVGVRGVRQLRQQLKQLGKAGNKALERAIIDEAREVFNTSQFLVPFDTGRLSRSGKILKKASGADFRAEIIYTAPYAIFVHEKFARHRAPTTWKFLKKALDLEQRGMLGRISDKVFRSLVRAA